MSFIKYNTVDEMLEYIREAYMNTPMLKNDQLINKIIGEVVYYRTHELLITLQKESNKPSKHDLQIINAITNIDVYRRIDLSIIKDHKAIMEIYKNRKVQ